MKRYLSWSGGKDSSASIVLCYENGIELDGIIFSEVMFDQSRNISGEEPEHIEWIYSTAIPTIEKMGYKVNVLRSEEDYLSIFNSRICRSKFHERNGKKVGFLLGGMCAANDRLKVKPIRDFLKEVGECEQVIGIAVDEYERLKRLKQNCWSILDRYKIVEKETFSICRSYNLLSPIYENDKRGGCWFCPNKSLKSFAVFKRNYPSLWAELEILSQDKEIVSQGFKYGKTFAEVDREVDKINNQLLIFDFI